MIGTMIPAVAVLLCCQGCCSSHATDRGACCATRGETAEKTTSAEEITAPQTVMDIELLALDLSTCDRCTGTDASIEAAVKELRPTLAAAGVDLRFRKTVVRSAEQATATRFQSSPTIRIDGRDLPIELHESRCGDCTTLCGGAAGTDCRVWVWQGREYTEAPKGLIVDAVLRAYRRAGDVQAPAREEFVLPENLRRFFDAKTERANTASSGMPSNQPCCDMQTCCAASEKAACCGTDKRAQKGACGCKPR